eukprot:1193975-Pyramimonas_sp.AAC.1
MKYWANKLTFIKKCQAISQIAKVNRHSWIPFVGEDLAAMSSTGKPVTDFFRPLCLMRNGSKTSWSYSVHIVSDSTIAFKDGPGKIKSSLLPEYNLRETVFGSIQEAMGGAQMSNI